MADKLSALALREVGSTTGVPDHTVEKLLDKYAGSIAKAARKQERDGLLSKLGTQTLEEASQLAQLRQERDARPTEAELNHAKKAARNFGALVGACFGAALTVAVGSTLLLVGTRSAVQGAAAGSMIARQADNVRIMDEIDRGEYEPTAP